MQRSTPSLGNPFLCPEFVIGVGRSRPDVRVAILADGPTLVGFFPFECRRFGVGIPIAAGLTDFQGLIHAPGAQWDPRELLRACRISTWKFDHLIAGQQPFEPYQVAVAPSPFMDLSDGFDTYREKLRNKSPRFCKEISYKARKLTREAGALRFVLDSPDHSALRTLMAWKSDQYRRTGRVDRFDQPWVVELVDYLLGARGDGCTGLLSFLYAGDVPVAGHFGLRFDHTFAGWFLAYDSRFHRYSPGLVQLLRMTEEIAQTGVRTIEMGKGAKGFKESLKSGDVFVAEGVVTRRSVPAALHRARSVPVLWAIRQVRQRPPLYRAADCTLRRYGRIRSLLRPPPSLRVTRHG
jgi:CelD/BcsL family acetyltransferase involved in cellulose biosynthesis